MQFNTAGKFSVAVFLDVCAFVLPWQASSVLVIGVIVLERTFPPFRPFSGDAHRLFVRFCWYAVGLCILLVVVNGFLTPGATILFTIQRAHFTQEGVVFGITIAARVILLSFAILLFFVSTPIRAFATFLDERGLPRVLVSIILLSVYFVEQLPSRISQIFTAQEARGAPVRAGIVARTKALTVVLAPLVLSSIVESLDRGVALELRGFHQVREISRSRANIRDRSSVPYIFYLLSTLLLLWTLLRWLLK